MVDISIAEQMILHYSGYIHYKNNHKITVLIIFLLLVPITLLDETRTYLLPSIFCVEKQVRTCCARINNNKVLMRPGGFEPPTPALGEPRSIHLSYGRKFQLNHTVIASK